MERIPIPNSSPVEVLLLYFGDATNVCRAVFVLEIIFR